MIEFLRLILTISKQNDLFNSLYCFYGNIGFACVNFGNMIGHVLILERTMATLFTTKYSQTKVPIFGICCISILVGSLSLSILGFQSGLDYFRIPLFIFRFRPAWFQLIQQNL